MTMSARGRSRFGRGPSWVVLCVAALGLLPRGGAAAAQDVVIQAVANAAENSPKESLRQKLFPGSLGHAACETVKISPRGVSPVLDKDLTNFIQEIIKAIQTNDKIAFQPLFHPRLNVKLAALDESLAKLGQTFGKPFEISVYRLWALNTVDGSPSGLSCPGDGVTLFPHYGYPLQFGLWLQVMGQVELGRIYMSLVPADGRWNIGAYHMQQWTHATKDAAAWHADAEKDAARGHQLSAYVKDDVAAKLLDGGGFVEMDELAVVTKARDARMTPAAFDAAVRAAVTGEKVLRVATLLVTGGTALSLRMQAAAELSLVAMQARCKKVAQGLLKTDWAADLTGIRCSYLQPGENPKGDGAMGAQFLPFSEVH